MGAGTSNYGIDPTGEAGTETPDARLWHPWLHINRVLRVMLRAANSAEAWQCDSVIRLKRTHSLGGRSG